MDTNQQGQLTELKILHYIIGCGYSASLPFGDKARYDQIWDIAGKLFRVQIKTARPLKDNQDGITFNCYSVCNGHKHRYSKHDIDLIATIWEDRLYIVPIEECSLEKILRFTSPQPAQPNINWAKDYLFEEVIKRL